MALEFNTFSNEGVPDGTIRPTYDAYYQETVNTSPINTKKGVFGGDFVRVLNPSGSKVMFSKTPIGGWSITDDGEKSNLFFHSAPEKLTDEIATNCAGGSSLDYDELLRYDDGGVDTSCSIVTEDRFGHGSSVPGKFFQNTNTAVTQGGVHYPTFCQMGDYVSTVPECIDQCKDISPNPEGVGDNYCHFAKNRLCGKLKGNPIKKNSTGGTVSSDKDWITDPFCVDYCGGPDAKDTDPSCLKKKNEYCANPDDWYSTIKIEDLNMTKAEYCKTFWKENFNNKAADSACQSHLTLNYNKQRNILSGEGCGILCPPDGKDQVNEDFCNRMKVEFCDFDAENEAPTIEDKNLYFDLCTPLSLDEKKGDDNTLLVIIVVSVCLAFFFVSVFAFRKLNKRSKYYQMSRPLLIGGRNNGYDQIIKFLHSLLYNKPCELNKFIKKR